MTRQFNLKAISNFSHLTKRLFIVFLLGFSSGFPLALVTTTLQAWFSVSGMSVLATGMLSLVGLPYLYRIFWGPLLDRYTLFSLGRRRSWMLLTQVILLLGFNALSWFDPMHSPRAMALIALVLACFSATQDIAIDAQRTEYLPYQDHGMGASLAVVGYRLGLLMAGGFALISAQSLGWAVTYRLMGAFMLVGIVATLWSEEPIVQRQPLTNLLSSFVEPLRELWSRPYFFLLVFSEHF